MQQIIEQLIQSGCAVTIDSIHQDGRLCGVIKRGKASFLFGHKSASAVYPSLAEYASAMPGLISWGAKTVMITENNEAVALRIEKHEHDV